MVLIDFILKTISEATSASSHEGKVIDWHLHPYSCNSQETGQSV